MGLTFFLDTANPTDWKHWSETGIFKGVTTNPTLLKESNQNCTISNLRNLAKSVANLGYEEMHIQAWGKDSNQLVKCGLEIAKCASNNLNIYIKLPLTKEGIKAAKKLINNQLKVTFTACYEPKQFLIASTLRANYIAPYLGRMNDIKEDGMGNIHLMKKIQVISNSNCKILVASIRQIDQILELAEKGIKTFTISPSLAEQLVSSYKSMKDYLIFEEDVSAMIEQLPVS